MKRMVLAVALCAAVMRAAAVQGGEAAVEVYVRDEKGVSGPVLFTAEQMAAGMYRKIGVHVKWHNRKPGAGEAQAANAIEVRIINEALVDANPDALAMAFPFGRARITVCYPQLEQRVTAALEPALLGHVLAHEIGHILEGTNRHSKTGVMKARWMPGDYDDMNRRPLGFEPVDIELIRDALTKRFASARQGPLPTARRER